MQLSAYRESKIKQLNGTPIFVGDAVFYVRRWGTPESQEILKELRKKLFGPIHKDSFGDDFILMAEWLIEYGCVNWEGVLEETADESTQYNWHEFFNKFKSYFSKQNVPDYPKLKHLPYSKKAARNIFGNPEYFQSLNNIILTGAMNFENYLYDDASEDLEAIKKN